MSSKSNKNTAFQDVKLEEPGRVPIPTPWNQGICEEGVTLYINPVLENMVLPPPTYFQLIKPREVDKNLLDYDRSIAKISNATFVEGWGIPIESTYNQPCKACMDTFSLLGPWDKLRIKICRVHGPWHKFLSLEDYTRTSIFLNPLETENGIPFEPFDSDNDTPYESEIPENDIPIETETRSPWNTSTATKSAKKTYIYSRNQNSPKIENEGDITANASTNAKKSAKKTYTYTRNQNSPKIKNEAGVTASIPK